MSTRQLAKKLGALEIIYSCKETNDNVEKQQFDYLFVLDFEATCWGSSDAKKYFAEIIEFPVVLFDVNNNTILDEFQQYVMPTENPKLSDFCKELTGIQQSQVDNGVPIQTCLLLFMRWLNDKMKLYKMDFPNSGDNPEKLCAFATWSDWDLGVCLKNECNRKRLNYHKIFKKWIDVRKVFKTFFKKPFFGLSGALSELGMSFEGNEHCGLHDARNTARLLGKLIEYGIVLQLTRT